MLLLTWGRLREDEIGSADPVDDFENGTQVGGNRVSLGEGFRPVNLPVKRGEMVNLVDSFFIGKNGGAATAIAMKFRIRFNRKDCGVTGTTYHYLPLLLLSIKHLIYY